MAKKKKKSKGRKKLKQQMAAMFIVTADGSLVFKPVAIWPSKVSKCFRSFKDPSRPMPFYYFWNCKAWMNSDIMETILGRVDRTMNFGNHKVILFLDNVTYHPESLQNDLTNIKLVFLPKNTTPWLQPLGASIIRNFKLKYGKLFLHFDVSYVSNSQTASQIIKKAHILRATP